MDNVSESRLGLVYPRLAGLVRQMAEQLISEDIYVRVVQGLRTIEAQDELYAQGRTTPGKIVTNARGGQSYHNFGLAVDCAPMNPDGSIDWNADHPAWKRMETIGTSLGLTSGASWTRIVDAPHFQLTGAFPENAPNLAVKTLAATGLTNLWAALDAYYSPTTTAPASTAPAPDTDDSTT